jgi:hypothetical protein
MREPAKYATSRAKLCPPPPLRFLQVSAYTPIFRNASLSLICKYSSLWGRRGRSWLRHCATSRKVAVSSLDCIIILPVALWPWGWLSLQQKWVPGIFPGGKRRPVRRADNLTTFMCRLSWNLEASTSWNPQGLSRPHNGIALPFTQDYLLLKYRHIFQ